MKADGWGEMSGTLAGGRSLPAKSIPMARSSTSGLTAPLPALLLEKSRLAVANEAISAISDFCCRRQCWQLSWATGTSGWAGRCTVEAASLFGSTGEPLVQDGTQEPSFGGEFWQRRGHIESALPVCHLNRKSPLYP